MRSATLDRIAMGLSGLCVLHCVASVVMVAALSAAGHALGDAFGTPLIHRAGLIAAMLLAVVALGQGYRQHRATRPALIGIAGIGLMAAGLVVEHGLAEVAVTVAGVAVLAGAHLLNGRTST